MGFVISIEVEGTLANCVFLKARCVGFYILCSTLHKDLPGSGKKWLEKERGEGIEVWKITELETILRHNLDMKKIKTILHISLVLVGILLVTSCGPSSSKIQTEETRRETEDLTSAPEMEDQVEVTEEMPTAEVVSDQEQTYQIVTLLPKDAIPSIDDPEFYSVAEADEEYGPDELIIGVEFEGEARAYSIPVLSSREIVNDNVGGRPIAVTW